MLEYLDIDLYKGVIAENYVASELILQKIIPFYWKSNNEAESLKVYI